MSPQSTASQLWQIFNRVYLGQISAIDVDHGTVEVVILDNIGAKRETLELPWPGMSMNGQRSSWMRYMPQLRKPRNADDPAGGDWVYVGFGPLNQARILGFAVPEGVYSDFVGVRDKTPNLVPSGDFTTLQQGEWDMRSSGGAYIFGNRDGALLVSAGPRTQMRLDKQNKEVRGESPLWRIGGDGSFFKIGDVKRTLPVAPFKETNVSVADPTALKEYWLHLQNPSLVPTAAIMLVDEQYGAVRDDTGVPRVGTLSGVPVPLRRRSKVWSATSTSAFATSVFSSEVDALGNHEVTYGDASTLVDISGGPITSLSTSFQNTTVDSTKSASVNAGVNATMRAGVLATVTSAHTVIEATTPVGGLQLGSDAAAEQAVLGTFFIAELDVLLQLLATVSTTLATFSQLVGTKTGIVPPSPDAAALEALTGALSALTVQIETMSGETALFLSEKVLVE